MNRLLWIFVRWGIAFFGAIDRKYSFRIIGKKMFLNDLLSVKDNGEFLKQEYKSIIVGFVFWIILIKLIIFIYNQINT